jgi:hypothetical protein
MVDKKEVLGALGDMKGDKALELNGFTMHSKKYRFNTLEIFDQLIYLKVFSNSWTR